MPVVSGTAHLGSAIPLLLIGDELLRQPTRPPMGRRWASHFRIFGVEPLQISLDDLTVDEDTQDLRTDNVDISQHEHALVHQMPDTVHGVQEARHGLIIVVDYLSSGTDLVVIKRVIERPHLLVREVAVDEVDQKPRPCLARAGADLAS